MDLENFELADFDRVESARTEYTPAEALQYLDDAWYTQANRRARWMDIIGDYAGSERFILDGACLFLDLFKISAHLKVGACRRIASAARVQ